MKKQDGSEMTSEVFASESNPLEENGLPGGGRGRREEVGHSGVYRVSDPDAPGDAEIRTLPEWGQGDQGAAGYFDHGESGVLYMPRQARSVAEKPLCRERLEAYLQANGVNYEVRYHPKAFTAEKVADREHLPGQKMAKVVVVMVEGKPVMVVLPASEVVNLKSVAHLLQVEDVRLAHELEFAPIFSDCERGAMPPFGNFYDLPVYVDSKLAEVESIVVQAGTATETIMLKFADFARLVKPVVGTFRWEVE